MVHKVCLTILLILCFQVTPLQLCKTLQPKNYYYCKGGANHWGDWDQTCRGKEQSPIDLPCSTCKSIYKENFPDFKRSNTYYEAPNTLEVIRSVDTVGIKPKFKKKEHITITGGPLKDVYILDHIHFHWGEEDWLGSEHSINGELYGMEVHAVHYNSKYESMKKAVTEKDGVLMIAYLFNIVPDTSDVAMNCVTCCFDKFYRKKTTAKVPRPFPISLLLPPFQRRYVTYAGSLTTPPCYESVTWIIHDNIMEISKANIEKFRALYCIDPGLRNNFRPRQPLNNRRVFARAR